MDRLAKKYHQKIVPKLQQELGLKNPLAVPRINKITVNIGIGDISSDKKAIDRAVFTLTQITGQKPALQLARKAIADFKIRRNDVVGLKVTLRKQRMYQFLDKLITIVLPRVRDFSGVKRDAFDQHGNYTLGLREQVIFSEVDYDKIDKVRGLEINITTSTNNKNQALRLLELLGMPLAKEKNG